jgi:hypothetical protein
MLMTSDGKVFVFAVFTCDGCECADFHSLHADIALAEAEAQRLRDDPEWFGSLASRYGEHGFVEVESHEVRGEMRPDERG